MMHYDLCGLPRVVKRFHSLVLAALKGKMYEICIICDSV